MSMFPARGVTIALLIACILAAPCMAETLPPGKYYCSGRVVKKADGDLAVFWGMACHAFPKGVDQQLQPYVGKFVEAEYTRISDEAAGKFSFEGSVVSQIDKVSLLADSADQLPVVVAAIPTKLKFKMAEPVEVQVTIINRSMELYKLQFGVSNAVLCQDYRQRFTLEAEDHYYDNTPYGLPAGEVLRALAPGEKLEFTVTLQKMVDPGTYQLLYSLSIGVRKPYSQSEFAQVTVAKPEKEVEERAALKKWLGLATVGQRITIAERLLQYGDTSGTAEVLRLLEANEYSTEHYCKDAAFRFAWQHGGEKGEAVMMALVKRQKRQDFVARMIEGVYLSENRLSLLQSLLAKPQHMNRDISGWIDRPRICDITAAWLLGYTDGQPKFPRNGSLEERDQAVASVRKMLVENPSNFRILSKSYR